VNCEPVGAQLRVVDRVRHVDAPIDRNAVELSRLRCQQLRHAGFAFVSSTRHGEKIGGRILVARGAQRRFA
jgi:hypothetical protein